MTFTIFTTTKNTIMKAFFVIICCIFFIPCAAQSFDCKQKIAEYQSLFQANKANEAYEVWSEVRKKCQREYERIYDDGVIIIQGKIKVTKSLVEKERLVREILKFYDDYYAFFSSHVEDYEVKKAMIMYYNTVRAKQQMEEIFILLDNGFTKTHDKIKDVNAINLYFNLYFDKYKSKDITAERLTEKYFMLKDLLNQLQVTYPNNIKAYKTVSTRMDILAKNDLTCNGVSDYYKKNYIINKDNLKWLLAAISSMPAKCTSTPTFYMLVEALYKINRTSQSAGFMGLVALKQKKETDAIIYYKESEALEQNPIEKAKLDYIYATQIAISDKQKAREFLNRALQFDPKIGKAYLYLAQLYAGSIKECNTNAFEKKALYYLAAMTAQKAVLSDPKLKTQTDKIVDKYMKLSFVHKDKDLENMKGKDYTIGCWINESIVVPKK